MSLIRGSYIFVPRRPPVDPPLAPPRPQLRLHNYVITINFILMLRFYAKLSPKMKDLEHKQQKGCPVAFDRFADVRNNCDQTCDRLRTLAGIVRPLANPLPSSRAFVKAQFPQAYSPGHTAHLWLTHIPPRCFRSRWFVQLLLGCRTQPSGHHDGMADHWRRPEPVTTDF